MKSPGSPGLFTFKPQRWALMDTFPSVEGVMKKLRTWCDRYRRVFWHYVAITFLLVVAHFAVPLRYVEAQDKTTYDWPQAVSPARIDRGDRLVACAIIIAGAPESTEKLDAKMRLAYDCANTSYRQN